MSRHFLNNYQLIFLLEIPIPNRHIGVVMKFYVICVWLTWEDKYKKEEQRVTNTVSMHMSDWQLTDRCSYRQAKNMQHTHHKRVNALIAKCCYTDFLSQ